MNGSFWGAIGLTIAMCLALGACVTGSNDPGENTPEEMAAVHRVLDQIKDDLSLRYPTGAAQFDMGELDEGCAVLLVQVNNEPVGAAFWTQGEAVYSVNDAARALNPALANAPDAITEERVRSVAD